VVPYDFFNHLMDAQRMLAARFFASIAPFSREELFELSLPEAIWKSAFEAEQDPYGKEQLHYARQIARLKQQAAAEGQKSRAGSLRRSYLAYKKLQRQGSI
jgi:hypothetical protein